MFLTCLNFYLSLYIYYPKKEPLLDQHHVLTSWNMNNFLVSYSKHIKTGQGKGICYQVWNHLMKIKAQIKVH